MKSMQKVNRKEKQMKVLKTVWNYTIAIIILLFATGIDSIVELIFAQF